jgi:hypothetical protein
VWEGAMNDLTARAKKGVHILEQAIIELLKQHLDGLTNYAIAKILEIDSDQEVGIKIVYLGRFSDD